METQTKNDLEFNDTIILMGPSGAGKTFQSFAFAKDDYMGIIDADNKAIQTVHKYGEITKVAPKIKVYSPQKTADGRMLIEGTTARWQRFKQINKQLIDDPTIKTISWDSVTFIQEFCKDFLVDDNPKPNKVGNRETMSQSDWGFLPSWIGAEIVKVQTAGKRLILCVHEMSFDNESTGMSQIVPALQAQLKVRLPQLASELWRLEVKQKGGVTKRIVRTETNHTGVYKTALTLPAEWEFNLEELEQKIKEKEESPWLKNVLMG